MNKKVEDHLRTYCEGKGWDFSTEPAEILEILQSKKQVSRVEVGQHRWYYDYNYVVEIDGMLIGYNYFECTGDNSPRDMDLELDLETVVEMEKYEETVTKYRERKEV